MKSKDAIGIIDIGSTEIRFCVAEAGKDKVKIIERINYPINLAKDSFNKGMIPYEKASKVCEILQGFLMVCKDYGISNIKAVATTAIREASNMPYILDQIKIKTGLDIKVLDDNNEKQYIFKLMHHSISEELKKSALVSFSGTGTVGVAYLSDGKIPLMESLQAGSLRINAIFENLKEYSPEFHIVLDEFIQTVTEGLRAALPEKSANFIGSGAEIIMIAKLIAGKKDENFYYIEKDRFLKFYDEIKYKSAERISAEYRIPYEKAEVIMAEMCIYKNLLGLTNAKVISVPEISLSEALAFEYFFGDTFTKLTREFNKFTILSAMSTAGRYGVSKSHYSAVEDFAVNIFDKMKKIHGLGRNDKLLLQTAAILHDCGKFVSTHSHNSHSYNIIKGLSIVGLSNDEIDIAANISLYHSRVLPSFSDDNFKELKASKKVLVSKLAAILRLADAMDRSRLQKLREISVKLEGGELLINAVSDKNCELEQWAFKDKGVFFEEVFGIRPVLKIRKTGYTKQKS